MKITPSTRIKLNDGNEIPLIGLGTWQLKPNEVKVAVLAALKAGYRHIDTASMYGNEKEIGQAINESGIDREQIFITTKLWNSDHDRVEDAFYQSMEKLGVEYLDLYLIHWPVSGKRNDSWKVLEKLKKEKYARSIGVSNYTITHMKELLKKCEIRPAVNQVEFNPYLHQKELLNYCLSEGIFLEGYCPLARGQKMGETTLIKMSKKYSKTPAQILIRWLIEKGIICIPKSKNPKRIKENIDVFDFELSPSDTNQLDDLDEGFRMCWDPSSVQ